MLFGRKVLEDETNRNREKIIQIPEYLQFSTEDDQLDKLRTIYAN